MYQSTSLRIPLFACLLHFTALDGIPPRASTNGATFANVSIFFSADAPAHA